MRSISPLVAAFPMISHDLCREKLGEFLDQTLDLAEREQVSSHLETCAECAQFAREIANIRATLREMPPFAAPPNLRHNVRAAIQNQTAARPKTAIFVPRLPAWAWSGTLALVAITLIVLTRPLGNAPLPLPAPPTAPQTNSLQQKAPRPDEKLVTTRPQKPPFASIRRENGAQKPSEPERKTSPRHTSSDRQPTAPRAALVLPRPVPPRSQERITASKQPLFNLAPSKKIERAAPTPLTSSRAMIPEPKVSRPATSRKDSIVSRPTPLSPPVTALRQESAPKSQSALAAPLFLLQLKAAPATVEQPRFAAKGRRDFSPPSAPSIAQNEGVKPEMPAIPDVGAAPPINALNDSRAGRAPRSVTPKASEPSAFGAAAESENSGRVQRFELRLQTLRAVAGARVRLELPVALRLIWPVSNIVWSGDLSPQQSLEIPFSLGSVRGGEKISVVVEQKTPGAVSKTLETQTLILPHGE